MRTIRTAALAAVTVFALTAVASASAHEFKATKYPVKITATGTNVQGFEVSGGTSVCSGATFKTGEEGAANPEKAQETLEVHPTYTGCEISIAAKFKAHIVTTGCNYVFHAAAPGTREGTVAINCVSGKEIKVEVEGLAGCVISVGSQTGLKSIEYVNESPNVKTNAEVSKIKWKATSACGLSKAEGENGLYREGEVVAGVAKLAPEGNPATAISKGTFGESESDLLEVV